MDQVIAHSVGTWNAVEFLTLARQKGLRMPRHVFLSAMASPDIPKQDRPWRQQRSLSEKEFQVYQTNMLMLLPVDAKTCFDGLCVILWVLYHPKAVGKFLVATLIARPVPPDSEEMDWIF